MYKTSSENETDVFCVVFKTAYKLRTRELTCKYVAAGMKMNFIVGTKAMEIAGTSFVSLICLFSDVCCRVYTNV